MKDRIHWCLDDRAKPLSSLRPVTRETEFEYFLITWRAPSFRFQRLSPNVDQLCDENAVFYRACASADFFAPSGCQTSMPFALQSQTEDPSRRDATTLFHRRSSSPVVSEQMTVVLSRCRRTQAPPPGDTMYSAGLVQMGFGFPSCQQLVQSRVVTIKCPASEATAALRIQRCRVTT